MTLDVKIVPDKPICTDDFDVQESEQAIRVQGTIEK